MAVSDLERKIYAEICKSNGIKAREIAKNITASKTELNRLLYGSPFMKHLCYRDNDYRWHGIIRQERPHIGLREFCGYYSSVRDFLNLTDEEWFEHLVDGCMEIGRNLNDTRGLFHSFRDCRSVMVQLFEDLDGLNYEEWEIVYELRINKSKFIRIYADVLVITEDKVFSLEFKMKDVVNPEELSQAAKYSEYVEVIFGPEYDVISVLVLTGAEDLYRYECLPGSSAELPVCSGDMLFNVFDEYLGFLQE